MITSFNHFATIHFPQNVPLDTQIAFITSLPKIVWLILDNFLQMKSEKDEGIFFRKQPSKRSSGDVKCNFDKPAKSFNKKYENFLLKVLKLYKLYFFLKKSSERSFGHLECIFEKPADIFCQKSEDFLPID